MSVQPIVTTPRETLDSRARTARHPRTRATTARWRRWIAPLASMRLTVWLMVLAVFVVLTFTFQLTRMDIWKAKSLHFPDLFVFISFQTYFPPSWFPQWQSIPGGFYCPSGFLVLSALLVNLFAAHLTRFRVVGQGWRLLAGCGLLLAGTVLSLLVIFAGQNPDGFQAQPLVRFGALWTLIQVALGLGGAACLVQGWQADARHRMERMLWLATGVAALSLAGFLVWRGPSAFIGDAAMRILWQLIQCAVPSLILLAGARWVFGRKAGMVAIHAGIAVLMLNEIYTSLSAVEQRIQFTEGQSVHFAYDLRHAELALVDASDPQTETHFVVPASRLQPRVLLSDPSLPFDVMCLRFAANSALRGIRETDGENIATAGLGLLATFDELPPVAGTKSEIDRPSAYIKILDKSTQRELGTFLVSEQLEAIESDTKNAPNVPKNVVTVGDRSYHVQLRFKRYYKPYRLKLLDTQQQVYLGTSTARYFSSEFELRDSETGLDIKEKVWMNNPLRYRNETFYQSGYDQLQDGTEISTLQVVRNHGWMIPYFCCVLVGLGLLVHFGGTLRGHLRKAEQGANRDAAVLPDSKGIPAGKEVNKSAHLYVWWREPGWWLWCVVPLLLVGWALWSARPRAVERQGCDLAKLGAMPIVHLGRAKPIDTVARSLLRRASGYEQIKLKNSDRKKIEPMVWMADALMGGKAHRDYELFRIDDPSLRNALGLDPRPGFRYTLAEVKQAEDELNQLVDRLMERPEETWTAFENRAAELAGLVRECDDVGRWLKVDWDGNRLLDLYFWTLVPDWTRKNQPFLAPLPAADGEGWGTLATGVFCQTALERAEAWDVLDCESLAQRIVSEERSAVREYEIKLALFRQITADPRLAAEMKGLSPLQVQMFVFRQLQNSPLAELEARAGSVVAAIDQQLDALCQEQAERLRQDLVRLLGGEELPDGPRATAIDYRALAKLPELYAEGDAGSAEFNQTLAHYHDQLQAAIPTGYAPSRLQWEGFYNRLAPYYQATVVYVFALIVSILGWLGAAHFMNRLASSLLFAGSLIHLLGVVLAVGISGRPPVTGLYSSFVFVTLGVVSLFLGIELFARFGIGNLLASLMGIGGLLWAWNIALGTPDTFSVMVAVLDTNFWLSTHVICISTGYVATLAAGLLGVAYLIGANFVPWLDRATLKTMVRYIYGITCFAMLCSFVGTVLGGLWADDSWGRFWGWDPKENGALMIVLWNAVLLHARWSGLARDTGIAALAVLGNIVVTWSWEGVNQLGVGLHAYALSDANKFTMLLCFWGSQLLIAGLAFWPAKWRIGRQQPPEVRPA